MPHLTLSASLTILLLLTLNLILPNDSDLLGTSASRVKDVAEPLLGQSAGQLQANDARTETQHLGVVGENGALDAEAVVCCHGADGGDFVGGDGDAEAWVLVLFNKGAGRCSERLARLAGLDESVLWLPSPF